MTVNKKSFSSRDIAQAFEGIGGVKALIKWAKSNNANREKFYQMFRNEIAAAIAGSTAPEPSNNTAAASIIERALNDIVNAGKLHGDQPTHEIGVGYSSRRASNIDDGNSDVPAHGNCDAPSDAMSDGITPKPKPDAVPRTAAPTPRTKPAPASNVVGLYAAAALGESPPTYGLNWSQTSAYPGRRFP